MQISSKLRGGGEHLTYWCQGCEEAHSVRIRADGQQVGPAWGYNGDAEKPTFSPSVLIRSGHFAAHYDAQKTGCWCTYDEELRAAGEEPSGFKCRVCHTFITDGMVQFLSDCTHQFAGQTLPLPDLPAVLRNGDCP